MIPIQQNEPDEKTIVVDTEADMKNLYSSVNHASMLYSKYFLDALTPLFPKIMYGVDPEENARNHLFLSIQRDLQPHAKDEGAPYEIQN